MKPEDQESPEDMYPSHEEMQNEAAGAPGAEEGRQVRTERLSALQSALGKNSVADILPLLSEEEQNLLATRFDLTTGQRIASQARVAELLGIEAAKYAARERKLMRRIHNLSEGINTE